MAYEFSTRAIHEGQPKDPGTGSITFPIYQTSTYGQDAPGVNKGYIYSRTGNPIRTALETNLASLEGARYASAFASGMSAIDSAMKLLKAEKTDCCLLIVDVEAPDEPGWAFIKELRRDENGIAEIPI